MGRPSRYTTKLAATICQRIADGESLRAITDEPGMPHRGTVIRWLEKHESFRNQYAHARDKQAETYAEDIVHIADTETDPQRAKIRIDARKWVAVKLLPKKYGDRVAMEHSGEDGGPIIVNLRAPE